MIIGTVGGCTLGLSVVIFALTYERYWQRCHQLCANWRNGDLQGFNRAMLVLQLMPLHLLFAAHEGEIGCTAHRWARIVTVILFTLALVATLIVAVFRTSWSCYGALYPVNEILDTVILSDGLCTDATSEIYSLTQGIPRQWVLYEMMSGVTAALGLAWVVQVIPRITGFAVGRFQVVTSFKLAFFSAASQEDTPFSLPSSSET
jgi:hypothetical protein